jgi:hypothetical protein
MAPVLDPLLFLKKPPLPPTPPAQLPSISSLPSTIPSQAEKAIKALLNHLEKFKETKKNDLLEAVEEDEQWIHLVVTMKKMPEREKHMPIRM